MVCCNSCSEWCHFTCVHLVPESENLALFGISQLVPSKLMHFRNIIRDYPGFIIIIDFDYPDFIIIDFVFIDLSH